MFYLANPPIGSAHIEINFGEAMEAIFAGAVTFTGADVNESFIRPSQN